MKPSLALITGATSGIGEALASLLAKKGIPLILTGRNKEKLGELKEKLGSHITTLAASLEKREEVLELIRERTPDLLINNAGFGLYGDAVDLPLASQMLIIEVNVSAMLELTLEGAKALLHQKKRGVILNVSSLSGDFPTPGMAVYGASKAFVTQFSQALDFEFSPCGIRVLVSCPGQVDTPFPKRAGAKNESRLGGAMSPDYAAKRIWRQVEKEKRKDIFDMRYRFFRWLTHFVPLSWVERAIYEGIRKRQ